MTSRSDTSVLRAGAMALGSGVATALLPPGRLPTAVRRSLHAALGLGTGGAVLVALSQPSASVDPRPDEVSPAPGPEPLPVPARIAFATVVGGLVALTSVGGGILDTKVEQALRRRGSRHPRVWIGAAAAALSAISTVVDQRLGSDDGTTVRTGPAVSRRARPREDEDGAGGSDPGSRP